MPTCEEKKNLRIWEREEALITLKTKSKKEMKRESNQKEFRAKSREDSNQKKTKTRKASSSNIKTMKKERTITTDSKATKMGRRK